MEISTSMWTEPLPAEDAWASAPSEAGLYRWFLDGPLPESFNWPSSLSPILAGDLLYVGRATDLRTRVKHHRLPTQGSTLRRTLASLMGYPAVWLGKSAHLRISAANNVLLTQWMSNNLLMSFRVLKAEEVLKGAEEALRDDSRAPLNNGLHEPGAGARIFSRDTVGANSHRPSELTEKFGSLGSQSGGSALGHPIAGIRFCHPPVQGGT